MQRNALGRGWFRNSHNAAHRMCASYGPEFLCRCSAVADGKRSESKAKRRTLLFGGPALGHLRKSPAAPALRMWSRQSDSSATCQENRPAANRAAAIATARICSFKVSPLNRPAAAYWRLHSERRWSAAFILRSAKWGHRMPCIHRRISGVSARNTSASTRAHSPTTVKKL